MPKGRHMDSSGMIASSSSRRRSSSACARRSWTEVDQARPKVGGSRPNVKRSWPEWTWPGSHAVIVALPRRADQQRVGGNAPHINNKKIGWG